MELQNTSLNKQGFTLLEIVIVMSLSSLVSSMAIGFSFAALQKQFLNSDIETVVQMLLLARSKSINNIAGKSYGVEITNDDIILFSGSYNPNSPLNISTHISAELISSQHEIYFDATTGNTAPTILEFSDGRTHSIIAVNTEGVINY